MGRNVLVDSCVLIALLRQRLDPVAELDSRAGSQQFVTCGMVRIEVLRGIKVPRLRRKIEAMLNVMMNVPTDNRLWEEATELAWEMDCKGTPIPATDVVIACCARRVGAAVLSYDRHFEAVPGLAVLTSIEEL